jgi:ankyrin repeat protein
MLLSAFCDLKLTSSYGYNALHYAVACRRYAAVTTILQRSNRALVHSESLHGCTAMAVAIDQELPTMIQLLIQEGGYDPERPYRWNETPLEHAIKVYAEDCAIALLLNGASVNRSHYKLAQELGHKRLMSLITRITPCK